MQHRFVRRYAVSAANEHDGQYLQALLDRRHRGAPVYADNAYRSIEHVQALRTAGFVERLHFRTQAPVGLKPDLRLTSNRHLNAIRCGGLH